MSSDGDEIILKSDETLTLGACTFLTGTEDLRDTKGESIYLRRQSLDVLAALARHTGQVVPKDGLIEAVWGDTFVTDSSLVQCIADIRRAIGDDRHRIIQSIPRRGYRLNASQQPDQSSNAAVRYAKPTLAVQSFTALGTKSEQDHFAEGLTVDLVSRLSMVRGLRVFDTVPASESGRAESSVDFLLTGAVRRSDERIRVNAQLLEHKTGEVLFSRRYDRDLLDLFEIQDEITSQIISETRVILTEGESARMESRRTDNIQAWEYFHQGWCEHLKYTADSNAAARALYHKALEEDPGYFDALVADGWAIWMEAKSSLTDDRGKALKDCRLAINALLKRWPTSPDVLNLDASLLVFEGRFDDAVTQAERSYNSETSLMYGRATTGWAYLHCGELLRARAVFEEVIAASPFVLDDTLHYYAHCLSLNGDHENAISLAQEYRQRVPSTVYGYTLLAMAQALAGQVEAAKATVCTLKREHPKFTVRTFRDHEPYRDADLLDQIAFLLSEAGLPP